ncbi:hypothetical protein AB4Z38_14885 [Arthrobacter sp. 2RAF6]|uniref:hypothetical protein n=1 Tax=Arthrobacter sp. 2RAF6 TaxID=3233002 RepID=UPI003F9067D8
MTATQHPRFARAYAWAVPAINLRGGTEHRRSLLAGLQAIGAAGFQVLHNERFGFSAGPLSPPIAHILGRAVSPGEPR